MITGAEFDISGKRFSEQVVLWAACPPFWAIPAKRGDELRKARYKITNMFRLIAQMLHIFASLSSKKKQNRDGKNAYDAESQRREDREGGMRHIIVL